MQDGEVRKQCHLACDAAAPSFSMLEGRHDRMIENGGTSTPTTSLAQAHLHGDALGDQKEEGILYNIVSAHMPRQELPGVMKGMGDGVMVDEMDG
jgi:hypothetical protein